MGILTVLMFGPDKADQTPNDRAASARKKVMSELVAPKRLSLSSGLKKIKGRNNMSLRTTADVKKLSIPISIYVFQRQRVAKRGRELFRNQFNGYDKNPKKIKASANQMGKPIPGDRRKPK